MRIISVNVNGIRAAHRKNFFTWLQKQDADVVCIQETKAQVDQLIDEIIKPKGYFSYFNSAVKKGYSGVAIYSRVEPDKVIGKIGWKDADREGRFLQANFGKLSVISLYLPSGSSSEERQAIKFDFLDRFTLVLKKMRRQKREYIICGDWNIAHKKIDIKNWKGNQKNSGFLPEERAWMDNLFDKIGMVDSFRVVNQQAEQYTWWSNRGQAWAKNIGWRIDYQVVTPGLKNKIKTASIYKDERFSDHAPLIVDYSVKLS
ncbi:MAG: exodeoxyribonuclease III [Pseudomonadota bacterium]|nr:exodeoxyribonuclease III [Pseudomonadota bacterium]|tara:strand:- start:9519 stop:10295 length:777 start_codon:yes stop_codon:yes gene_type:complete